MVQVTSVNRSLINKLKGVYNHIMAVSDSEQLDKEKLGETFTYVLSELNKNELEREEYEDKFLIDTPFGYVKLDTTCNRIAYSSSNYTKEFFHTMEEIERIEPKYKAFAEPINKNI